jgi:hypothetical protein
MKPIYNFRDYLKSKKITFKQADTELGLSAGYVSKQINAGADLGASFLNKIIRKYTDLSINFLILGVGKMFEEETRIQERERENQYLEKIEKLEVENEWLHHYVKKLEKENKNLKSYK